MNRKKILKSIQALSGWRETAFMLALAERALPNVVLYLESVELYQDMQLKDHRDLMQATWQHLVAEPDESEIAELLDEVSAPIEVLEQDENYGARPSTACLHLWEQALLSELNREKPRALEASQASLQTVMDFIEFSEGDDLSENALVKLFDRHNLMTREFAFQDELVERLRNAGRVSKEFINELRELAQDEGVSNLGISLSE